MISTERVGRRIHDIQSGLRDIDDSVVQSSIPLTINIGMAAMLAVHIRGMDVITNIHALRFIAKSLGISQGALSSTLNILEEIGWIRVTPNTLNPRQITETVPIFSNLYPTLGEQWHAMQPGEIEQAMISITDALILCPEPADELVRTLGIDTQILKHVIQIGELGGCVKQYYSPKESKEILFSPLFSDAHPERVFNFIAQHGAHYGDINNVFRQAQNRPGIPVDDVERLHPIVGEMISGNIISAPAIDSSGGRHHFLFPTLRTSVDPAISNKARVLLSCVRYGERFSTITNIFNPIELLERLKDSKVVGKTPHSNIGTQYSPAAIIGIGYIEEAMPGRFRFKFYDTPDNIKALDLAIEMASGIVEGEVEKIIPESAIRRTLAGETLEGIVLPGATRPLINQRVAARKLEGSNLIAKEMQAAMMDDIRGVCRVGR